MCGAASSKQEGAHVRAAVLVRDKWLPRSRARVNSTDIASSPRVRRLTAAQELHPQPETAH